MVKFIFFLSLARFSCLDFVFYSFTGYMQIHRLTFVNQIHRLTGVNHYAAIIIFR